MIYEAALTVENHGEVGEWRTMPVVEYEGRFWLVVDWLESLVSGAQTPTRIVTCNELAHAKPAPQAPHFAVMTRVPISVLDGPIPPELETLFEGIDSPPLKFSTPGE